VKRRAGSELYRAVNAKHISVSLLLLAGVATAHADPVADFKAGTGALVRKATVSVGGSFTSTNIAVQKKSGTLDFELRAADLGVDLPITIDLLASSVGNGRIHYVVDKTYSPALDLGDGHWMSSVTGAVDVVALPLAGEDSTREHNARLTAVGKNYVEARGDWGVLQIPLSRLEIRGGVPQPPLESFSDTGRTRICSDRAATSHSFAVSLAGLAQVNGATVLLDSTQGAGVMVPSGVSVPKGRRSVVFPARIAASFAGTVRLTAAAGGVSRSLTVSVFPPGLCGR
jgi:hypothetical protein